MSYLLNHFLLVCKFIKFPFQLVVSENMTFHFILNSHRTKCLLNKKDS